MLKITYPWMQDADVAEVGRLARRIWNAHYPGIVTQAQIDFMLEDRYNEASLRQQMAEGQRFLLAVESGQREALALQPSKARRREPGGLGACPQPEERILGFLSLGPLAQIADPLLRGEAPVGAEDYFLHKFYLAPERQGQGLGKGMLAAMDQEVPQIRRLRLQVNRRNENSWQFYLKQGFHIVLEQDFSIGGGFVMEDYVMEKTC